MDSAVQRQAVGVVSQKSMVQAEAGAAPVRTLLLDGGRIPAPGRQVGGVRILVLQRWGDGVTTMRARLRVVLGGTLPVQLEVGVVQVSRPVVGTSDKLPYE